LLLFGALRDDYTAVFFFLFLAHDNNQPKAKRSPLICSRVYLSWQRYEKQTQIIQKVGHLFTIFSYSTRPKMISPYLNSQCQSLGGGKGRRRREL
jgi:hypothetical protein